MDHKSLLWVPRCGYKCKPHVPMEKGTKMVGKIPPTRVPVTRLRRELYTLHAALGVKTLIIYT